MIPYVLRLARWEWFKQRRRWLPWVLLAILMLIPQVFLWGSFAAYNSRSAGLAELHVGEPGEQPIIITCEDILSGELSALPEGYPPEHLDDFEQHCYQSGLGWSEYEAFAFPSSLSIASLSSVSIGLILAIILTGSVLGTEYGWGTLRNVLARGTGRWQLLAGKGALLVMLALGGLLGVVLLTSVSSFIATAIADAPLGYASSDTWPGVLADFGRVWFAVVPYIALSAFATVLTGSSNLGQALSMGYYIGEMILAGVLSSLFDWFDTIGDYLLGQNVAAWMSESGNANGLLMVNVLGTSPGQLHAALVLAAYIVGLSGLALWRFSRRDVGGASGG